MENKFYFFKQSDPNYINYATDELGRQRLLELFEKENKTISYESIERINLDLGGCCVMDEPTVNLNGFYCMVRQVPDIIHILMQLPEDKNCPGCVGFVPWNYFRVIMSMENRDLLLDALNAVNKGDIFKAEMDLVNRLSKVENFHVSGYSNH